jgi:hypothetical protein
VAESDTDHCLVVANVSERLAVNKRAARKIDTERFKVKKLNERGVKEQYQITIRYKFVALKNLKRMMGTSTGHGSILERISDFRLKRV